VTSLPCARSSATSTSWARQRLFLQKLLRRSFGRSRLPGRIQKRHSGLFHRQDPRAALCSLQQHILISAADLVADFLKQRLAARSLDEQHNRKLPGRALRRPGEVERDRAMQRILNGVPLKKGGQSERRPPVAYLAIIRPPAFPIADAGVQVSGYSGIFMIEGVQSARVFRVFRAFRGSNRIKAESHTEHPVTGAPRALPLPFPSRSGQDTGSSATPAARRRTGRA